MATPALDEAIAARFAPPFHSWYDVTHDGPPGREHTVESKASPLWSASAAPSGGWAEAGWSLGQPEACAGAERGPRRSASWPKPAPPLLPTQALRGALPARPLSFVRVPWRGRGARAARGARQRGTCIHVLGLGYISEARNPQP